ncbi:YceI family protein [Mucilaginibacter gynuensis]|uniref:YceI family protein n=1 Tax=Mucilaginibacter gynuensis TaxID=1302236 RepID=A0ABP8G277_9SPHI
MLNKLTIILLFAMFQLTAYGQQTYRLDIKKSKLLWNGQKTMGGHFGYILFNAGTLNYTSEGERKDGTFTIDMNTMRATDHTKEGKNKKVDDELRTPGFFDVAQYPTATMAVKQIIHTEQANNYKVTGDLTIKGITNPITFTALIKGTGNTLTATAATQINRVKWRIDFQPKKGDWNLFAAIKDEMITENIDISLNLVFNK